MGSKPSTLNIKSRVACNCCNRSTGADVEDGGKPGKHSKRALLQ